MRKTPIVSDRPADPLAVFDARCAARSYLVCAGDMDLHEAVDELQSAAERNGLINSIGQTAVQAIMARHFAWRIVDAGA